jgi:hypothetical protein
MEIPLNLDLTHVETEYEDTVPNDENETLFPDYDLVGVVQGEA